MKTELDWVDECHDNPMYAAEHIVKLESLIQKMVDAWDNNDRSEYQTIIQQMEECCEQRFSARDV